MEKKTGKVLGVGDPVEIIRMCGHTRRRFGIIEKTRNGYAFVRMSYGAQEKHKFDKLVMINNNKCETCKLGIADPPKTEPFDPKRTYCETCGRIV